MTIYDHEIFKIVALEKCQEAGVEILLYMQIMDTHMENGRQSSVTLFGKSRRIQVSAHVFSDATGDGYVAYLAGRGLAKLTGEEVQLGQEIDGNCG